MLECSSTRNGCGPLSGMYMQARLELFVFLVWFYMFCDLYHLMLTAATSKLDGTLRRELSQALSRDGQCVPASMMCTHMACALAMMFSRFGRTISKTSSTSNTVLNVLHIYFHYTTLDNVCIF
jgi:hypothetical protein